MNKQEELYNEWKQKILRLQEVGNILQNNIDYEFDEGLCTASGLGIDIDSFEKEYKKCIEDINITYHSIMEFLANKYNEYHDKEFHK